MRTTNPLLKATRAALTELTTSEAQEWYRATAARAMAIARRSIVALSHLLGLKPETVTERAATVPEEVTQLSSPRVPYGSAAIEANDVHDVSALEEDATELRLCVEDGEADSVVARDVVSTEHLSIESGVSEAA